MAKRKRLTPARMDAPVAEAPAASARPALSTRPPIADVAHDAAASAALTEVAAELTAARSEGRLIQKLPLDVIDPGFLVRDRVAMDATEMQALVASLEARGQQTPIEVSDLGAGRYGLISGYRRYTALREVSEKNPALDTVLAVVRAPQEAAEAYLSMVEENEVRVDLSFYERGRIVARAKDAGVYRTDALALSALFAHVPRARRSKIGSFVGLVRALDDVLRFPTAISEKLGLAVAKQLGSDPGFTSRLKQALQITPPATAAEEVAVLTRVLRGPGVGAKTGAAPAEKIDVAPGITLTRKASGRVELSGDRMRDPDVVARLIQTLKSL